MFLVLLLFFSMLLLCSFSGLQKLLQGEKWFNHVSLSCLENVQNLGRSDDGKQKKKF